MNKVEKEVEELKTNNQHKLMEEKMEEPKEKKERDYADGLQLEVTNIEAIDNPKNTGEIVKVSFETNKGRITYKPKIEKTELVRGLPIKKIVGCLLDDLPEKIFEMIRIINEKGKVNVKATYQIWNTEQDGEPVTYRYVHGAKMFDKWEIIKEEVKEEVVG